MGQCLTHHITVLACSRHAALSSSFAFPAVLSIAPRMGQLVSPEVVLPPYNIHVAPLKLLPVEMGLGEGPLAACFGDEKPGSRKVTLPQ